MAARSTRRTIEGSITWRMNAEGVQGAGRTTRKGTKGASRNVQGREEVFANVSAGADTKANTRALVRAPGGLLERLQRDVALEVLRESSSSLGTEMVVRETASMGAEVGC